MTTLFSYSEGQDYKKLLLKALSNHASNQTKNSLQFEIEKLFQFWNHYSSISHQNESQKQFQIEFIVENKQKSISKELFDKGIESLKPFKALDRTNSFRSLTNFLAHSFLFYSLEFLFSIELKNKQAILNKNSFWKINTELYLVLVDILGLENYLIQTLYEMDSEDSLLILKQLLDYLNLESDFSRIKEALLKTFQTTKKDQLNQLHKEPITKKFPEIDVEMIKKNRISCLNEMKQFGVNFEPKKEFKPSVPKPVKEAQPSVDQELTILFNRLVKSSLEDEIFIKDLSKLAQLAPYELILKFIDEGIKNKEQLGILGNLMRKLQLHKYQTFKREKRTNLIILAQINYKMTSLSNLTTKERTNFLELIKYFTEIPSSQAHKIDNHKICLIQSLESDCLIQKREFVIYCILPRLKEFHLLLHTNLQLSPFQINEIWFVLESLQDLISSSSCPCWIIFTFPWILCYSLGFILEFRHHFEITFISLVIELIEELIKMVSNCLAFPKSEREISFSNLLNLETFQPFYSKLSQLGWFSQTHFLQLFKNASTIGFKSPSPISLFPSDLKNFFSSFPFQKLPNSLLSLFQFLEACSISNQLIEFILGILSLRKASLHPDPKDETSFQSSLTFFNSQFIQAISCILARSTSQQFQRIIHYLLPKLLSPPYLHQLNILVSIDLIYLKWIQLCFKVEEEDLENRTKSFLDSKNSIPFKIMLLQLSVFKTLIDTNKVKHLKAKKLLFSSLDFNYFIKNIVASFKNFATLQADKEFQKIIIGNGFLIICLMLSLFQDYSGTKSEELFILALDLLKSIASKLEKEETTYLLDIIQNSSLLLEDKKAFNSNILK